MLTETVIGNIRRRIEDAENRGGMHVGLPNATVPTSSLRYLINYVRYLEATTDPERFCGECRDGLEAGYGYCSEHHYWVLYSTQETDQ